MKHLGSKILKGTVILASCLTFGVLLFLIAYILIKGLPNLSPKLVQLTLHNRKRINVTGNNKHD